ncbi:MAG: polymorphic toxin-type HINT domain-containing protein, partial [Schlesneria sp.]
AMTAFDAAGNATGVLTGTVEAYKEGGLTLQTGMKISGGAFGLAGNAAAFKQLANAPAPGQLGKSTSTNCLGTDGCFVAGTLVNVSSVPDDEFQFEASKKRVNNSWSESSVDHTSRPRQKTVVELPQSMQIPIQSVPLGSRVTAQNPNSDEYDDSLPEPESDSWLNLTFVVSRRNGQLVDVELLRPRSWASARELSVGKLIPVFSDELEINGVARVVSIEPCPPLASGEGNVVIGRFVTRQVETTVAVTVSSGDVVEGTTIHPVWSHDQQDWVPLGKFTVSEQMVSQGGVVTVESIKFHNQPVPVYNIEVFGEHVYEVTSAGILVHNANPCLEEIIIPDGKVTANYAPNKNLYDVGLAKDLRKNPVAGTQVNHAPQSREAESLVGDFNVKNKVGNEPAIRLPIEEHEAVSAAQYLRTATTSARDLLASEIRILRQTTNAPNSALQELIDLSKKRHPWDYFPLHRTNP